MAEELLAGVRSWAHQTILFGLTVDDFFGPKQPEEVIEQREITAKRLEAHLFGQAVDEGEEDPARVAGCLIRSVLQWVSEQQAV